MHENLRPLTSKQKLSLDKSPGKSSFTDRQSIQRNKEVNVLANGQGNLIYRSIELEFSAKMMYDFCK